LSSQVRGDAKTALAAGQQVKIEMQSNPPAESLPSLPYAPDVHRAIEASRTARTRVKSNVPGVAFGAAFGTSIGAGIGYLVLEPLKANHPAAAVLLNAALAVIGGAVGGAEGRDLFDITETYDSENRIFGWTISSGGLGGDFETKPFEPVRETSEGR